MRFPRFSKKRVTISSIELFDRQDGGQLVGRECPIAHLNRNRLTHSCLTAGVAVIDKFGPHANRSECVDLAEKSLK